MKRGPRGRRSVAGENARARALTRAIVRAHFGRVPSGLRGRAGGMNNFVFEFRVRSEEYVIRLNHDPTKLQIFQKQRWAMDAARKVGVPTPRVLEVGHDPSAAAYMILEKVEGQCGLDVPAPHRLSLLSELGRLAKRLHTVRTHGFGPVFDWSDNALSRRASWGEFLDSDLEVEQRLGALGKHLLVPAAALAKLRQRVAEMRRWRKPPVLHHGDLRLKNVIVDAKGGIASLIDWDESISAPPPYHDLSIALHDLWADEQEALLDGYGMRPTSFTRAVRYLRALNALHYAAVAEDLTARRQRARLEWMRLRLRGELGIFGSA
jgi:hygromycin-B 4-O-kinase